MTVISKPFTNIRQSYATSVLCRRKKVVNVKKWISDLNIWHVFTNIRIFFPIPTMQTNTRIIFVKLSNEQRRRMPNPEFYSTRLQLSFFCALRQNIENIHRGAVPLQLFFSFVSLCISNHYKKITILTSKRYTAI